jgi:hypothetical protein
LARAASSISAKVLQGDRFFALLMVRALTYEPEYAFGVGCRNDNCRARIEWELDLTKLPVRKLSEEERHVTDEQLGILEQGTMARVGIQDQLGVLQALEHEIRVLIRKHRVGTSADDKHGMFDPTQGGMLRILARTPLNQRFGLRTGH